MQGLLAFKASSSAPLDFTRYAMALASTKGDRNAAARSYETRWKDTTRHTGIIRKAAASPGVSYDASWAGPLSPLAPMGDEFVELLRPLTVVGKLTGKRTVPFDIVFTRQTGGAGASWVGEGQPIAVSAMALEQLTFTHSKIGGICVITDALARSATPQAVQLVQDDLTAAGVAFTDAAFLDPARGAVANVSPASITNGATAIASTGSDAVHVEADLKALTAAVSTNMAAPFFVMKTTTALSLATLRASGARVFPDVGAKGGSIWGVPVLVTAGMPMAGDGSTYIVLVDAADVLYADDGAELDASTQALIQMDTAPDNPATAATVMTSLWQRNLTGVRLIRYVRWQRRRDNAVAYLLGVNY